MGKKRPQPPDMGIFRPVEIQSYDVDAIEDVFVLQNHKGDAVELEVAVASKRNAQTEIFVGLCGSFRRRSAGVRMLVRYK